VHRTLGMLLVVAACSKEPEPNCRAEARGEVLGVFSEVRIKQEQRRVEQGIYKSLGPYTGASVPPDWADLRFVPYVAEVTCTYSVAADEKAWTATALCDAAGVPVRFWTTSSDPETYSEPDAAALTRRTCPRRRSSSPY
jgi:hypothetical protein